MGNLITAAQQIAENEILVKETVIFNNGIFYVVVNCLIDDTYKIAIFDWQPPPEEDELNWDPLNIKADKFKLTIKFNVAIFPHNPINPLEDFRFKDQYWAKKFTFNITGFGLACHVDTSVMYEILSYIEKISKMKAFL